MMGKNTGTLSENRELLLTAARALPDYRTPEPIEIDPSIPGHLPRSKPDTIERFFEYVRVRELYLAWDELYMMAKRTDASPHFWSLLVRAGEGLGLDDHENGFSDEERFAEWMAEARQQSWADGS